MFAEILVNIQNHMNNEPHNEHWTVNSKVSVPLFFMLRLLVIKLCSFGDTQQLVLHPRKYILNDLTRRWETSLENINSISQYQFLTQIDCHLLVTSKLLWTTWRKFKFSWGNLKNGCSYRYTQQLKNTSMVSVQFGNYFLAIFEKKSHTSYRNFNTDKIRTTAPFLFHWIVVVK